jgi:hypothetical protein
MGYQESFVTTVYQKDFSGLIKRIKFLGKDYYNSYAVCSVEIITAKQNIYGNDD